MYYQNYDDYMRDVFYFNQMPSQNFNYPNIGYNNMQNLSFQGNNGNPNFNNMYPSIYRIVQPVVSRVVTGNNYQYMSDDNLNSMVDTVYNIVESDVVNTQENDKEAGNSSSSQNQRNNNQNASQVSNASANQSVASSRNNNNNQNSKNLLKDLIKILLIKEIINRNNIRRFTNSGFYGFQNFPNYYDQRYVF